LELVNQIGGAIRVVEVVGDYAYINVGSRLVILDVSDPTQPTQVGQSDILPGVIRDIEVGNGYAYVLLETADLWLINVTQPTNPQIVGTILPDQSIRRMEIEVNTLYLSHVDNDQQTITLFDITNPSSPVPITSYISSGWWKPKGNTLYIFYPDENNLLAIWDISDPFHPQKDYIPASVAPGGYLYDVSGTRLYFYNDPTGATLQTIDISDLENPALVGQDDEFRLGSIDILALGNTLFIEGSFCDAGSCGAWVDVLDLSNPQSPEEIRTIGLGYQAYGSILANELLFAAASERLVIIPPDRSSQIGVFEATGNISQLGLTNEKLYALNVTDSVLHTFSLTNPAQPAFAGGSDTLFYNINDIFFTPETSYVATGQGLASGVIGIFDTHQIEKAAIVSTFEVEEYVNSMTNIVVDDGYGYLLIDGDLSILDVRDVANPQLITRSDEYRFGSFFLHESLIFGEPSPFHQVASSGVHVIDVQDPSMPKEVGYLRNINRVVAAMDGYAFAQGNNGLKVLELSEPANIRVINSVPHSDLIRDATITENYLVLVSNALELYDISLPTQPKFVTSFPLFDDGFHQIEVLGDNLYVSGGWKGVWVFRIVEGE